MRKTPTTNLSRTLDRLTHRSNCTTDEFISFKGTTDAKINICLNCEQEVCKGICAKMKRGYKG